MCKLCMTLHWGPISFRSKYKKGPKYKVMHGVKWTPKIPVRLLLVLRVGIIWSGATRGLPLDSSTQTLSSYHHYEGFWLGSMFSWSGSRLALADNDIAPKMRQNTA